MNPLYAAASPMSSAEMPICRYIDASPFMIDLIDALPGGAGSIEINLGDPSPDELRALLSDADLVLNGHTFMDAAVLAAAPKLRSIVFLGSGASSYVDLDAARERGIAVRTVPGYGDRAVAEHAFALLLAAARDVAVMDREMREGAWRPREGLELGGKTLGVVGLAGIGREMVRIASGFGMNVVAWNRSAVAADLSCEMVGFDDIFARSDAVSLHLGLTAETRGIVDAGRIAAMKPGAILVNTARAGLVDTAALVVALRSGALRHAALDVFDMEPLPVDDELASLPNVTLTAHAAFKTREASLNLIRGALAAARADIADLTGGRALR
jgi:D-3-phosphoglycerate dehydrogenase